jgi:drug/metabolite transporter (DMT)-like permease
MPTLLAANGLEIVAIALAALVFAGVLWVIWDVLTRPDFTGFQKILWIVFAIVFNVATLIVYVFWVRKRDYSRR